MERKTQINYIVVGDYATGKTSLLNHFFCDGVRRDFAEAPQPTLCIDFKLKRVQTERYGLVEFLLRDTSSMERYNQVALTQTFYRGAEGVLLVFDVTRRETLEHLASVWMPRLRAVNTMHPQCRYMVVGNKVDLVAERRVSREEAQTLAHQYNMEYAELSSLTADCETVREPFMRLAALLISERVCVAKEYALPGQSSQRDTSTCCQ
jgi:Ras-related protein Rab-18